MFFNQKLQLLFIILTLGIKFSTQQSLIHFSDSEFDQSLYASRKSHITERHEPQSSGLNTSNPDEGSPSISFVTTVFNHHQTQTPSTRPFTVPGTPPITDTTHSTKLTSQSYIPGVPSTITITSPINVTVTSISISTLTKPTSVTASTTTDTVTSTVTATSAPTPTTDVTCCAEPKWLLKLLIAILVILLLNLGGVTFSFRSTKHFHQESKQSRQDMNAGFKECRKAISETEKRCQKIRKELRNDNQPPSGQGPGPPYPDDSPPPRNTRVPGSASGQLQAPVGFGGQIPRNSSLQSPQLGNMPEAQSPAHFDLNDQGGMRRGRMSRNSAFSDNPADFRNSQA